MGYTHYYQVAQKYDGELFTKVAADFNKMIPILDHLGAKIGAGWEQDKPIINEKEISFNGVANCGHTDRNLGITWPSKGAKGVSNNGIQTQLVELTNKEWFAGASLETRVCGGDCTHEDFTLLQELKEIPEYQKDDFKKNGLIFQFTKTAYKPYDLAVNVVLIIAKHYLGKKIKVSSDGEIENWQEGMQLCDHFLGYGLDFKLECD
jgi:hypothetical protein